MDVSSNSQTLMDKPASGTILAKEFIRLPHAGSDHGENLLTARAPENHLLLFYQWPAGGVGDLIARIGQRFAIRKVIRLCWSPEHFDKNLWRLYALPPYFHKLKLEQIRLNRDKADVVPFLLIIVNDMAPCHRFRIDGAGLCTKVNVNTFELKHSLRADGMSVHVTNSDQEFRRDIMLLLGQRQSDMSSTPWEGNVEDLHTDIIGTGGWRTPSEVFSVLNETSNYVVLRDFESLPDTLPPEAYGGIDILVEDERAAQRVTAVLNANGNRVNVGDVPVLFSFRHADDLYFDPGWARDILTKRVLLRGVYVPSPENHFFSLHHHAYVYQKRVPERHLDRLRHLARELDLKFVTEAMIGDPDEAARFIDRFLRGQKYCLTEPADLADYNIEFASRIPNTPRMRRIKIGIREHLTINELGGQEQGLAAIQSQIVEIALKSQSRRWLSIALLRAMMRFPRDLLSRLGMRR